MLSSVGLLLLGFIVLIGGAQFTVKGAISMANRLNISAVIIGLTVVAFGTALPEFVLSIRAAMRDVSSLVLGNVMGSCINNILLILGITAMVAPFKCNVTELKRDYVFLMMVIVMFIFLLSSGSITKFEGLFLLFMLLVFLGYNYRNSKFDEPIYSQDGGNYGWLTILFMIGIGIYGLIYGSGWLLDGAVRIAKHCGVPKEIIGLTLIAFGTSLPELATTITASMKHHPEVAIGNIIGSNIMNILLVMGFTAFSEESIVVPKQFMSLDVWVMFMASASLLPVMYKTKRLSRLDGLTYFFAYIVYMIVQAIIASVGA